VNFFCTEQRPILICLLKERKTNINITFVQSSVVCYIPLRDKGRQRNVSNSSLWFRFVFFRWFYMLFMKFMKLGNHVFSFAQLFTKGHLGPKQLVEISTHFFSLSATVSTIFTVGAKCMKYRLVISIHPCDKDADNATSQLQHQIALSAEYSPQPAALLIHFSRFSRLW